MRIVAITVTYNRIKTLIKNIESLSNQTQRLHKIIVVDNNSTVENKNILIDIEKSNDLVEVVWLNENKGGAGGFYHGMKYAMENYNPDWYWLMDDDAYPKTKCLEILIKKANEVNNIGFLAPSIWGIDKQEFQLYHHKKISNDKLKDISIIDDMNKASDIIDIEANAFVGPIFPKKTVERFGFPDEQLFIYGDDTEYTYRITRYLNGYLVKDAIIEHQDQPNTGKIVSPKEWWKEYYMYRNRFLFINKFEENKIKMLISKYRLIIKIQLKIIAAIVKRDYRNFRNIRITILRRAIIDGIRNFDGKTIDPKEYINNF